MTSITPSSLQIIIPKDATLQSLSLTYDHPASGPVNIQIDAEASHKREHVSDDEDRDSDDEDSDEDSDKDSDDDDSNDEDSNDEDSDDEDSDEDSDDKDSDDDNLYVRPTRKQDKGPAGNVADVKTSGTLTNVPAAPVSGVVPGATTTKAVGAKCTKEELD